ncbi:MAG: thioredoxin family protein, partial [Muribaculaceae bacterium]|nr:thioredoxin family protein [Muribaculaceae bacterium]
IKKICRNFVKRIVKNSLMKKYKISAICFLMLCCLSYAAPTAPQTKDITQGMSFSTNTKERPSNDFFTRGYGEIHGQITDYNPESDPKNFLVYFDDNLIGSSEPISVDIANDGSFITWTPLSTPGYVRFVGNKRHFDFFLKPENTLEVSFSWDDVVEYCKKQRNGDPISESPFHFKGDLGRINQELAAYQEDESYGVYQMAHDLTPSEAIKEITESYEKQMLKVDQYCEGKALEPTTRKLLEANVKSKYLFDVFEYARTLESIQRTDTLAPSLKEPLDLQYFENVKDLLAENDEWILASNHFGGIPNMIVHSQLSQLLSCKDHYAFDFGVNAFPFLKSLGATLTPEEEEFDVWLGDGGTKSCTLNELYPKINAVRTAAERNGLSDELNEFYAQQRDTGKMSGSMTLLSDVPRNVTDYSNAIKEYLGVDSLPLLWQVALSEALRSKYMLNANNYQEKDALYAVLEEVKNIDAISNPAIIESLDNFYRRSYARKSFDIPDDEKGKVINKLIAPFSGKMLLLDFWDITCGPCCYAIKNSVKAREKNRGHTDFQMIFISDDSAPQSRYEDFVIKYLEGETTYRISESDFHLLRDLFAFSGIPRYVLIGRDGKVLDSNFDFYGMKRELKEYGIELEGDVMDSLLEEK